MPTIPRKPNVQTIVINSATAPSRRSSRSRYA
jgi:hypothetical protein